MFNRAATKSTQASETPLQGTIMSPRSQASAVERQFQRIADDAIRRTERIQCTLEQRQQGLGAVITALQTMLYIVTEQRLRS
jgi:hypothetical protein